MKNDTVEQITPRSSSKSVLPATGRQDSDLSWLGLLLSGLSLSGLWTRKKKKIKSKEIETLGFDLFFDRLNIKE